MSPDVPSPRLLRSLRAGEPGTPYAVWAPRPRTVALDLDGIIHPMSPVGGGWWSSAADVIRTPGARYGFRLDGGAPRPDPRSPRQPDGVHGLSVVDIPRPASADAHWAGRPLAGSVLYELHVGTFTPEGTLDSAIDRLDHVTDLGVDMVELMPVTTFDGDRNWGYDGVAWFAVHEAYGGPDALRRFVDACHARGIGVCLDVVYNHFGPIGNHLPEFGPYLSADGPWGAGVNVAGAGSDEVREFICDNALRWFSAFGVDALRLDAVHALHDPSATHILAELAERTDALATHLRRPLTLIAESDLNDPRLVTPRAAGGYGLTAQWNDDVHHAIHTAVSGERQGYYADFGPLGVLADTLRNVFLHRGPTSAYRGGYSSFRGRIHGRPVREDVTPASAFLAYTTTHDQVGNRAAGDRPSMRLSPGLQAVKAALVLCSPYTPMLFMGEEWGASTPFAFFTSHTEPDIAEATRTGRRREFAAAGWDPESVPDPQDPATFEGSRLRWAEKDRGEHVRLLDTYRRLIALRREHPALTDPRLARTTVRHGPDDAPDRRWLSMTRGGDGAGDVTLVVNLGTAPAHVPGVIGGDTAAVRVLAAWAEPRFVDGVIVVPPESFAVVVG